MQSFIVVVLAAVALVVVADEFYDGRWNDVDAHAVVDNDRAFTKYCACIENDNETGCPKEALELKRVLPEALKTKCAKCSPVQVEKIKDTLGYICLKRRTDFDRLLTKFDSEGKLRIEFEEKYGKLPGC